MNTVAFYDTKPYERKSFESAAEANRLPGIFAEDHSSKILQDDALSRLLMFPNVLITTPKVFLTGEVLSEFPRVTTANLLQLGTGEAFIDGTTL